MPAVDLLLADDWRIVPGEVARLVKAARAAAQDAAIRHPGAAPAWVHPGTGHAVAGAFPGEPYLLAKRAASDYLKGPADAFAALQRPLGGPHPLAATLAGGALGAGLGWGSGALLERLLPVERGRLRRTLAVAGGAAGAAPGLAWGGVNAADPDRTGGGLRAWTSPWPFAKAAAASVLDDEEAEKRADAGGLFLPTIPVDAFNRAVWSDVRPATPFGTRSPWGDNDQPLGTPPAAAAAVSGLVAGAGAATGQAAVSPFQVGLAAGVAGGKGYLAGLAAGKVLGALAGLDPGAQRTLQQLGLWGGVVAGVARSVFG